MTRPRKKSGASGIRTRDLPLSRLVNGKRDPTCVWEGGGHTCGVEEDGGVVGRVMVVGRLTHRVGVRVIMIRRLMERVVVRVMV